MASSSFSPSAQIFSSQSWNYDVFLSFRGEDTRKTFVDHLYTALDQQGIHTYKDDVSLPRGESISPSLLNAIEESQIAVIIFSENYANSTWCLDELTHIMKCRDTKRQIVMPIFYDVEPIEVRKQEGKYKESFENHEQKNKEKVVPWRKALVGASNISGWEVNQIANGHESQGIKQVIDEISQSLNLVTSEADGNLIGMRTRVQALKSKLKIESGGVRMVGIWGVGGGGKTTLASSCYDEICCMFKGCCFLNNIREESSKNGLEKLQEKILSSILKNQVQVVGRVEEGGRRIKARLSRKKVLIVLDDVDHLDQLKALVGSREWFGKGSRIIITTRDENLLNAHGVDVTHNISFLNHDEAVKLFCKHAKRDCTPMEGFEKLSKEVVSYAGGLPLALTVLGAFLCDKNVSQWRSALARLKEIPHKDIIGILRISFDGLEAIEKELFLDIACFYRRKQKSMSMKVFDSCGLHPVIGVEVLRQKALITIRNGMFDMHDLVQEMGHYIVRGEHPKNPEKHSRVWKKEHVRRILAMDETTKLDNIEAIDHSYLDYEEMQRFLQVAGNMNKLRWIHLPGHSFVTLPEKFPPPQLCYLYLENCLVKKQLWKGYKHLPNLTHMELKDLPDLIEIPAFSGLPNLETFKLFNCRNLEEIHPSVGLLENLVFLSIVDCRRLRTFPSITQMEKLETLIFNRCSELSIISVIKQKKKGHRRLRFSHNTLRKLDLSLCRLGDEEIGSDVWELPNLEQLNLSENYSISRLDFSILRLPQLKWLNVSSCYGLVELSQVPPSIAVVIANDCSSLESIGDVSNCKWLWKVSLARAKKFNRRCADALIHSMFQRHTSEDHFISVAVYQHQLPNRFTRPSRMHLPDNWYNDFCGFLICIATECCYPFINITINQEDPPLFDLSQKFDKALDSIHGKMTHVGYFSFSSLRHTTLSTSSYNYISFTVESSYEHGETDDESNSCGGIELIPRKSKSDEVHTTDSPEFWDKKIQYEYVKTFKIRQHVSKSTVPTKKHVSESSIHILWEP